MKFFKNRAAVGLLVVGSLIPLAFVGSVVAAGPPSVGLGTAGAYGVLAGDTITNTGATTINGDLGLFPGSAVVGSPTVIGASNVNNSAAQIAKNDLRTAYLDAEGRSGPTLVAAGALGGRTLAPGLYKDDGAPASLGISTGQTLTLSGDSRSVWIFQSASTLITETGSRVVLTGGAQACNVFWQVGSSTTLKTGSTFVGTVLAHTDISVQNSVTIAGRLLAGAQANGAGALTLDTDTITRSNCATVTSPTPTTPTPTTPTPTTPAPAKPAPKPTPAKPAPKKVAAVKRAVTTTTSAGGSTSVSGPALPPVNTAGFTG